MAKAEEPSIKTRRSGISGVHGLTRGLAKAGKGYPCPDGAQWPQLETSGQAPQATAKERQQKGHNELHYERQGPHVSSAKEKSLTQALRKGTWK